MSIIYKTTDRIKYNLGEIQIEISPLDYHDKSILHTHIARSQTGDVESLMKASAETIKRCVKSITGLCNPDGTIYELQFEANDKHLTDECVSDLLNIQESNNMINLCGQLIAGIPSQLPKGVTLVAEGTKGPNERKTKK